MAIDEIYEELIHLKYTVRMYNSKETFTTEVVNKEARDIFKVALADALSDQFNEYKAQIAKLEAKVFAYEAILKNSNFAMAVTTNEQTNNTINKIKVNASLAQPIKEKEDE